MGNIRIGLERAGLGKDLNGNYSLDKRLGKTLK